nr:hypothetical protein HmN_001012600 [Hymenolepis microstoma]CUU99537.1 hypothetical transcript [Hymenolepis microstoma]
MFHFVTFAPLTNVSSQVIGIVVKAQDNGYDTLKSGAINSLSDLKEKRLKSLHSLVKLGKRTTSRLLWYNRSLVQDKRLNSGRNLLRPAPLNTLIKSVVITRRAETAPEIVGKASTTSNIKRQDLIIVDPFESNCQQSSMIANPMKESGIELFQTDSQELSKEPSDLADDSNPEKVDIYDFLPEHSTASLKTREKRKRTTPKPTAVNQQNLSILST